MRKKKEEAATHDMRDSPMFWLIALESARDHADPEKIAEARRELHRLGIEVHYRPRLFRPLEMEP